MTHGESVVLELAILLVWLLQPKFRLFPRRKERPRFLRWVQPSKHCTGNLPRSQE